MKESINDLDAGRIYIRLIGEGRGVLEVVDASPASHFTF